MSIRYYIEESNLKNNKGYVAKVKSVENISKERLIRMMVNRGTTLTAVDISSVLLLLEQTLLECLLNGQAVNINNLMRISLSIKGVYSSFFPTKEVKADQVNVGATFSKSFIKKLRKSLTLEICEHNKRTPIIYTVQDQAAGRKENSLTIGNMITITGKMLSFNLEKVDEGVFLENQVRKEFIKVDYTEEVDNLKLKFILKDIPWEAGEKISIRVRKRFKGGKIKEEITAPFLLLAPTPPAKPKVLKSLKELNTQNDWTGSR